MVLSDIAKKSRMIASETVSSFRRNNDLAAASSMAFSAMLALIPALFLLTALLGMAIGSSQEAFRKVQELATQVIPNYSQEIMKDVSFFLLYLAFSRKFLPLHLAAGALASAGLWYLMGPLFHKFLAYNPGYGLAFGSFMSLFVVIIWIYYSLVGAFFATSSPTG